MAVHGGGLIPPAFCPLKQPLLGENGAASYQPLKAVVYPKKE